MEVKACGESERRSACKRYKSGIQLLGTSSAHDLLGRDGQGAFGTAGESWQWQNMMFPGDMLHQTWVAAKSSCQLAIPGFGG